jgi:hypothetical protein
MAAVIVEAMAMFTRRPLSAAFRRNCSPIARASPSKLPRPLISSVTTRSPCVSMRGEKSRARVMSGDRPSSIGHRRSSIVDRPSAIVDRPSAIGNRRSSIGDPPRLTLDDGRWTMDDLTGGGR